MTLGVQVGRAPRIVIENDTESRWRTALMPRIGRQPAIPGTTDPKLGAGPLENRSPGAYF